MRSPGAFAALMLLVVAPVAGCHGPVTLDAYRGLYATHFEGIPDRAAVCAVLTNRSARPVEWVRLRLRASTALGDEPLSWSSNWVFPYRIEPGESRALRLPHPPVVEEIKLAVRRAGRGPLPPVGRLAEPASDCTQEWLTHDLEAELADRTAPDIELHPISSGREPVPEIILTHEGDAELSR
jgi:hypothetical protein